MIKRNGRPKSAGCFLRVAFILEVRVFGPSGRASNAGMVGTVQETERHEHKQFDKQTLETTCLRQDKPQTQTHLPATGRLKNE